VYSQTGRTNIYGQIATNNARLPATWRLAQLSGPCAGDWGFRDLEDEKTELTMECALVSFSGLNTTSFDADANPETSCCDGETLMADDVLYLNDRITSSDGRFKLVYQGNGNLVLYNQVWGSMWSSQTANTAYGYAYMQADGNFLLVNGSGPYWHTGTAGNSNAWLIVQSDGNVVLYSAGGSPLWHTGTCCY
jgi:hypothetical protein